RFPATMEALTPACRPLRAVTVSRRSLCFICPAFLAVPPPTTPRAASIAFDTLPFSVGALLRLARGSGLRLSFAGSPSRVAESCSPGWVSHHPRCGPAFHLLLLPTSHRCDAVAVGYRSESASLKRTYTSLTKHTCRRTSG